MILKLTSFIFLAIFQIPQFFEFYFQEFNVIHQLKQIIFYL